MNKNTIIVERNKLRAEIKDLVIQYESLKEKDGSLETIGPIKAERMFEILNSIAMRYAKDGFIEYAESWLLKAEPLTVKNPRQAIILHNNMACIFKNQGSFDKALKHLEQSEAILKNIRSKLNYNKRFDRLLIDCWLNLSAIYSSKKMHLQALHVIESTEELILHNMENGYEKFMEQYIIARYNRVVELEHLNKVEQAYYCCDETKKIINDKRVYGHFLEKKIGEIHQDLRIKLFGQNKHKRTQSLANSLNKLKESLANEPKKQNFHSRKMSSLFTKANSKLEALLEAKENCNALTYRSTRNQEGKYSSKSKIVASIPGSRLKVSPMMEITNKKITIT